MLNRRTVLASSAALALSSLLAVGCGGGGSGVEPETPPAYRVTVLPRGFNARTLNDSGQLLLEDNSGRAYLFEASGFAQTSETDGDPVPALYSREGVLAGFFHVSADALTEQGMVAVNAFGPGGIQKAFVWRNGSLEERPVPAGASAVRITALAPSGAAVGTSESEARSRAILWRPGEAPIDLGDLGGGAASANDINARGEVVGASETGTLSEAGTRVRRAFVWRDGRMTPIEGLEDSPYSEAWLINDSGTVVGTNGAGAFVHADGWTRDAAEVFGVPVNRVSDLNNRGDMIGARYEGIAGPVEAVLRESFVRIGGRTVPTDDLLPAEWRGRVIPVRINDQRYILARQPTNREGARDLLLTPVD